MQAGSQLRLRTVPPLEAAATLRDLPGIHGETIEGEELVVRGDGDVLHTVANVVHDAGVVGFRPGWGRPASKTCSSSRPAGTRRTPRVAAAEAAS
ncbi:hypothetical protein ER308_04365 [Egibacter rhizosphaerae]|uniref:Uncharacterized protein n=1 Tax=Egibacter rhizosphaerae TaxID=1670831 RepID=A0A411YCC3_9ACTN|nr:hypothetical protein [Egibacter rhizosphaerae]QBI18850.1 hypothetical protein ER308_04365 [Egibacter rhizosphaerae]